MAEPMLAPANAAPQQPLKLRDAFVARIRAKHYAPSTEKSYWGRIVALCRHHRGRHPRELLPADIEDFLSHLATARNVSASTQNQALAAILFLYRDVYDTKLPWIDNVTRAKRPKPLPLVLGRADTQALRRRFDACRHLLAALLLIAPDPVTILSQLSTIRESPRRWCVAPCITAFTHSEA